MKPIYITVSNIKDPTEGAIYSGDTLADYLAEGWGMLSAIPTDTCVHYILTPPPLPHIPDGAPVNPPKPGEI